MIIGRNIQPALNQEHVAHWILLNDQANERFDEIADSFADSCFQRIFASRAVFWCDQNYRLFSFAPLAVVSWIICQIHLLLHEIKSEKRNWYLCEKWFKLVSDRGYCVDE